MKHTLREINNEIRNLVEELEDAEDEAEQNAILKELDALDTKHHEKMNSIASVRLNQKAQCKTIDEEIKRLQQRKKSIINAGERIDNYVLLEMKSRGIKSYKGDLASITRAKSPTSCRVTNGDAIPEEFTEEVVEVKILKKDIITHFKNTGEILPGVEMVQGEHIRIR